MRNFSLLNALLYRKEVIFVALINFAKFEGGGTVGQIRDYCKEF